MKEKKDKKRQSSTFKEGRKGLKRTAGVADSKKGRKESLVTVHT